MNEKAAWGVLGMGVMGTSLSRNLARKGIRLALYNRFLQGEEEGSCPTLHRLSRIGSGYPF